MTPASITQWLQEPHRDIASGELQSLQDQYPYFIPLHYMAAATKQEEGQPVKLSGYPHLYRANWLLFHQMMQQASKISIIRVPAGAEITGQGKEEEMTSEQKAETIIIPLSQPETRQAIEFKTKEEPLIRPVFSEDYFLHQGIKVNAEIPEELNTAHEEEKSLKEEDPKSLMVVMSFADWLTHFRSKSEKEKEEESGRKAVKHMWQMEKLSAVLEDEDDEIPENVFEMAVNSITKEDGLASESLAEIMVKQGKWSQAIEMYRKLSLRNPQKSAYFAQQISEIQKKSE